MRILILGATGAVGRLVVEEAAKRRHEITVLVRSPQKLGELAARVRIVQGDALDRRAVSNAVAGQDAVIYVLGAGNVRQTTLFSDSTRSLLTEMERRSVGRLICVTGVGAGETKGHGGFLYDRILFPLFTKRMYEDKDIGEGLIQKSSLDWVIVRPAMFREGTAPGKFEAVTDVRGVTLTRVSDRKS